jgi:hypothetical protein
MDSLDTDIESEIEADYSLPKVRSAETDSELTDTLPAVAEGLGSQSTRAHSSGSPKPFLLGPSR